VRALDLMLGILVSIAGIASLTGLVRIVRGEGGSTGDVIWPILAVLYAFLAYFTRCPSPPTM
jgi:hypothetical protein